MDLLCYAFENISLYVVGKNIRIFAFFSFDIWFGIFGVK